MAKRSLYASNEGAKLARKIFDRRGWTQENLAAELDLRTRQPIWRFFTCRPIERYIFIELCTILDLNWWEIAEDAPEPLLSSEDRSSGVIKTSQLAEQIRLKHQDSIGQQCGTLRMLGTSCPVKLDALYVTPHLLGRFAGHEYADIAQLDGHAIRLSNLREHLESITSPWQALEEQPRLRILGKPGSGKTTLLKWIALQCSQGQFQPHLIPVLIKLGSYMGSATERGEFSLLQCIQQELLASGVSDNQAIETLLNEGKFLLLLDELDEIPSQSNVNLIFREICKFVERYHKNRVIVTSRLGNQNFELLPFTDFELADFNDEQIALLAKKWFGVFEKSSQDCLAKADEFINQLTAPANQRIRELAGVPLFFNRICQIFQGRGRLFEHRGRIYEECLALWLHEWDRKRGVQRSSSEFQIPLSIQMYILGQIAIYSLEKGCCFFEQIELDYCITASIREQETDDWGLVQDEIATQTRLTFLQQGVLLEQACGIFSFSHIAFQEHLAARQIVSNSNLKEGLAKLFSHLTEPVWREVFLLVSSRLQDRTPLLEQLELEIQTLVAQKSDVKRFLSELQQASSQWLSYRQAAEVYTLFCQLARTPELILRLAAPIASISALAQMLLLEVVLAELTLWFVNSASQDAPAYAMVQALLNQAVILAVNCQHQTVAENLLQFGEQVQSSWAAIHVGKRQPNQAEWLECLGEIWSEYFIRNEDAALYAEYIQSLQLYRYIVQLLAACQDQAIGNRLISAQVTEYLPVEFRQSAVDSNQLKPMTINLKFPEQTNSESELSRLNTLSPSERFLQDHLCKF